MLCLCYGICPQTAMKGGNHSFLSHFISDIECILANEVWSSLALKRKRNATISSTFVDIAVAMDILET